MKVEVEQKLIDSLRLMLVRLAVLDITDNIEIERPRQYCEGYLGINREKLKSMNYAEVEEVLSLTGHKDTP